MEEESTENIYYNGAADTNGQMPNVGPLLYSIAIVVNGADPVHSSCISQSHPSTGSTLHVLLPLSQDSHR